jgi:hypothetical protein
MDTKAIYEALNLGDEIECDLKGITAHPILAALVAFARAEAVAATKAYLALDPLDPKDRERMPRLQNEWRRYGELVSWIRNSQEEAAAAFEQLNREQRSEILNLIDGREGFNDA